MSQCVEVGRTLQQGGVENMTSRTDVEVHNLKATLASVREPLDEPELWHASFQTEEIFSDDDRLKYPGIWSSVA